jgi:hypothetical protein
LSCRKRKEISGAVLTFKILKVRFERLLIRQGGKKQALNKLIED